jgi:Na+-translocating ferredoxin:NAD+ oxidoreductase subunit B
MSLTNMLAIESLLPQTQCEECGYPGCRPYAQAISQGKTDIAQCAPGGLETLIELATLLGRSPAPYIETVKNRYREPATAVIDESVCIGCTKCIQACPVDAIVGTGKLMHSILKTECTGCGLCIEPCPVDCIQLEILPKATYDKKRAADRFEARTLRLNKKEEKKFPQKPDKLAIQETLRLTKLRIQSLKDK